MGKLKGEVAILPDISQFKVWFDKKEHFSQIKLDRKTKSLEILAKAPVEKWNFQKKIKLPSGRYYCFFSQLPECLKEQKLLEKAVDEKVAIFIIWDNYPFHNEIYKGLSSDPYTRAFLSLAGHDKNTVKYALDVGNQSFFIHYDKDIEFKAYYWISQGISAVPVGKE
jgi:transposase